MNANSYFVMPKINNELLKKITGSHLRILVYCLQNETIDIEAIQKDLSVKKEDIEKSLDFLKSQELLVTPRPAAI